ncbi:FAD-binding oxidoreductase [Planosporangium mesophilum]|uniref:Alkyldihydroxyacetonephosphate synthase n=1 Tax=Planosporangium mesophilum TaxID=689768 RepID=A0A8J3X260_9ACTN|nr:FAD-binding oxidoreductase [Planosporangium mesophilum]NJC86425.1 FAD-binding oxidoreductase [Planosporangium mesophilum]GII25130.1 alkyldihydroxyacetonephosphate synthase [Planosporangium mesophilum]
MTAGVDPTTRQRSWWGWGWSDQALPDDECVALAALVPGLPDRPLPTPAIGELAPPRVRPPASLADRISTTPPDRAAHTYGKAYRDVLRALHGDLTAAPDLVAFPRSESDVVDLLDWAGRHGVAVVPYGAGSSVVGGVEYRGDGHAAVLSLDLSAMDRVLEVDTVSRAARIQAGALGPMLEDQLRPYGYTLRHFPQSFEFSTLGGWLATRSGGHYATLYTHIDDLTESLRVVTPVGVSESWRLPGSGAGPSPDRLFLGSEGTLGVITEAWMRVQQRPRHKASTTVTFTDVTDAMDAVRAVSQAGLYPANCRLLDPGEAAFSGLAGGGQSVLLLGVESADRPVDGRLAELVDLARDHGGTARAHGGDQAADAWRSSFLRMPYLRDGLARMSAIVETFETACTWDRVHELYRAVYAEVGAAINEITGSPGVITCRITHVYPDGPAPYFTVIAAGRRGREVAMWDEIKAAAMEVLGRHRATVTHHHAVGRDHRPGYDRQRPEPFAVALRAAKAALDPYGVLNPGVLVGPS